MTTFTDEQAIAFKVRAEELEKLARDVAAMSVVPEPVRQFIEDRLALWADKRE